MKAKIAQKPVAVAVDASNWHFYQGGVYQVNCGTKTLNHSVVVIGYDSDGNYIV